MGDRQTSKRLPCPGGEARVSRRPFCQHIILTSCSCSWLRSLPQTCNQCSRDKNLGSSIAGGAWQHDRLRRHPHPVRQACAVRIIIIIMLLLSAAQRVVVW